MSKDTPSTEKGPKQALFVKIFHPVPGKSRSKWPVKKQYVTTQAEYLELSAAEQANSKAVFMTATKAAGMSCFDRSAEYPDKPTTRKKKAVAPDAGFADKETP